MVKVAASLLPNLVSQFNHSKTISKHQTHSLSPEEIVRVIDKSRKTLQQQNSCNALIAVAVFPINYLDSINANTYNCILSLMNSMFSSSCRSFLIFHSIISTIRSSFPV